ncbi:Type IV fimbrial biogenesis protein PilX [Collimonas arenae]|uniref:Type IV fimbrial biogenesis protein PilX n=1 Tax=Collimonas arenae TaxID=279058 RepID=A0A0A1FK77_9BURK|nr:Type IV fimbrial biogenesis protein PilX [Collimonas arenae]
MVLFVALIVLIAMTLAALALMRSVDSANIIAGNLAFQEAATHSADTGVEAATAWLQTNNTGSTLDADDSTNGYAANGSAATNSPGAGQSWDNFWSSSLATTRARQAVALDSAGNNVSYVIDRLCNNAGSKTGGASCVASPVVQAATGNAEEAGQIPLNAPSVVYYRITVRVSGPRNTVSYVQAVVSM